MTQQTNKQTNEIDPYFHNILGKLQNFEIFELFVNSRSYWYCFIKPLELWLDKKT